MSKYVLFTQDVHDEIRWDYTTDKIQQVLDLWNEGYRYVEIGKKLSLRKIEVMLILLDLAEQKKIPERAGGLFGNRE